MRRLPDASDDTDEIAMMSASHRTPADPDPARPRLEDAISNPGAVKINVEGAFIVENEPSAPDAIIDGDGVHYEGKDIRLPHHTTVVSHVAVDVSFSFPSPHFPHSPQSAGFFPCERAWTSRMSFKS